MIHKFDFDGIKIVLDVNSGAVHVFDEVAWTILDDYNKLSGQEIILKYGKRFPKSDIRETLTEIRDLENQGMLFSEDAFQDRDFTGDMPPVVKSICLNVSHDCNLRCRYCFAGSGHFGGERAQMSLETGKKAIEFLLQQSAGRRHCELDFFGGEPLMNISVVEGLVAYGRRAAREKNKEIKFTLTTNAVLLNDEITEFLNSENINVVLSLDGRPEINDAMRWTINGAGGSYRLIQPKITSFIKSRGNENYFVRGTYTRLNLDFAKDVLHLADLGYKYVSVEPVVGGPGEDWTLREQDLPVVFDQYQELTREFVGRGKKGRAFEFFHFNLDLDNGPCLPKRLSGCGAGHEYMAVTPDGNLYPCHQFAGQEKFILGNVWAGIVNYPVVDKFRNAHIYSKEKCRQCWAKFHCGGGCHANAQSMNGNLFEPYGIGCELEKKRLECAIYVQVLKAGIKS